MVHSRSSVSVNSSLKALIGSAKSVALLGASDRQESPGSVVLENLRQMGYLGSIYVVNPNRKYVGGLQSYDSVRNLPEVPRIAVCCVGRNSVGQALRECADVGVGGAIVLAAGFGESEDGAKLENELEVIARETGLQIIGPNCLGLISTNSKLALYSAPLPANFREGGVGLISHTGSGCIALTTSGRLGFSYVISAGNEVSTRCGAFVEVLVADRGTGVIAVIMETLRDPEEFKHAALAARQAGKPVVVLKLGGSEKGAAATATHTGALAGDEEIYDALFRSCGVVRVNDFDELIETVSLFDVSAIRPLGRNVALAAVSGGESALVCDLADKEDLVLSELSPHTLSRLKSLLPEFAAAGNPLDVTAVGVHDAELYGKCVSVLHDDMNVDLLLIVQDASAGLSDSQTGVYRKLMDELTGVGRTSELRKPIVVVSSVGQGLHDSISRGLSAASIPLLQGAREGVRAVAKYIEYYDMLTRFSLERSNTEPGLREFDCDRVKLLIESLPSSAEDGRRNECLYELLRSAGVDAPPIEFCESLNEAVSAADCIGYPVAVKVVAQDVHHKSDIGGVRVGISNASELQDSLMDMRQKLSTEHGLAIDGFDIQGMAAGDFEAIVGFKHVDNFGSVIVVGVGGVMTELVDDVAVLMLPVDDASIREAINSTRLGVMLRGIRGGAPADLEALVDMIRRIAAIADESRECIRELEINPVVIRERGCGASAVDVSVRFVGDNG